MVVCWAGLTMVTRGRTEIKSRDDWRWEGMEGRKGEIRTTVVPRMPLCAFRWVHGPALKVVIQPVAF